MTPLQIVLFIFILIGAYFLGNLNSARFISKKLNKDITKQGSGNPGTMNMLRTFGFKIGLVTLCLDVLKGVIPSLTAYLVFGGENGGAIAQIALYSAGLAVICGHNFPVFYNFKGGKGVACILGVFLVADPLITLLVVVCVFIYLCIFDYASVGSFIMITAMTLYEAYKLQSLGFILEHELIIKSLLFIIFFLTWFMHRQNIFRMLIGKENKVNLLKSIKNLGKKKQIKKENKEKELG